MKIIIAVCAKQKCQTSHFPTDLSSDENSHSNRVGNYENLQNSFLSNNFVHVADAQVGVTVIYMGRIALR